MVECLPSTHEALGSFSSTTCACVVIMTITPAFGKWRQEDEELQNFCGQSRIHKAMSKTERKEREKRGEKRKEREKRHLGT